MIYIYKKQNNIHYIKINSLYDYDDISLIFLHYQLSLLSSGTFIIP